MTAAEERPSRFISLRWRMIVPTFAVVLVLAMVSAYIVARSLPSDADMSRVNVLLNSGRTMAARASSLTESQRGEVERLARMPEVITALRGGSLAELPALLENFARRADIDAALVTAPDGSDIAGVLRDSSGAYVPATLGDAAAQTILVSAPLASDTLTGITVYGGVRASRWMDSVRGNTAADVALYRDGQLLATTSDTPGALPAMLPAQYLGGADEAPFQALTLNDSPYLGAYFPLNDARQAVAVFMPDNAPFAAEAAQQLIALTLVTVAAAVVITLFVMSTYFLERINRVREVAEALAGGEYGARTHMQPTDEIGALGRALDLYTERTQERYDHLRGSLRRQRREVEHLNAVIEAMADGVIIQDLDGNVTFINERAKRLIGEGYNFFKRAELREITQAVTDILGPALAPGLYTLGTPARMELDRRTLSLQAFAVMSLSDRRVGTVIVLRDVTEDARQERARALLLDRLVEDVEQPLADTAFSREIKPYSLALQKLIVEMRALLVEEQPVQMTERSLPLETLVWAVANEWRQVAQAANLSLNVEIERPGLSVFGDERRLRWAIGNIVDNAIKYTPPGGKVSIEIKDEENGYARVRIRDNGVGIAPDELPHVFTRFYRGSPVSAGGRELNVPGTGQGLSIAKQIIEAGGGRIYLRSSPDVGTAVYFTLPLTESVRLTPVGAPADDETMPLNVE